MLLFTAFAICLQYNAVGSDACSRSFRRISFWLSVNVQKPAREANYRRPPDRLICIVMPRLLSTFQGLATKH